jgi:hypothetical protein
MGLIGNLIHEAPSSLKERWAKLPKVKNKNKEMKMKRKRRSVPLC